MSAPARRMPVPWPADPPGEPEARPFAPDARPTTPDAHPTAPEAPPRRSSPSRRRVRRRRHHLGFAILASAVVGSMVFGIVVLHVLLAQHSFRMDGLERRIETLATENLDLARTQATLSAPGRIAGWATRHGMRLPDDIRILRAPKGPSDPAGAGTTSTADIVRSTTGGEG